MTTFTKELNALIVKHQAQPEAIISEADQQLFIIVLTTVNLHQQTGTAPYFERLYKFCLETIARIKLSGEVNQMMNNMGQPGVWL